MTDTEKAPAALKPTEVLRPFSVKQAVHARGDHFVWIPRDTPYERILLPGYWAHNADAFKKGDKIEVCREDMSLDVTLRVVDVRPGLVFMREMFKPHHDDKDLDSRAAVGKTDDKLDMSQLPDGYKLGYAPKGATPGHFVHHRDLGKAVVQGLPSKQKALEFAIEHAKQAVTPVT